MDKPITDHSNNFLRLTIVHVGCRVEVFTDTEKTTNKAKKILKQLINNK
jgi:hypothetical protein